MTSASNAIRISSLDLQRINSLLAALPSTNSTTVQALDAELLRARIVEPTDMPPNVVTMNSTVRFAVEPTGKTFELQLVYPKDAAELGASAISVLAPVGSALLGLSEGQSIDWVLPGGRQVSVRVIEVVRQPEREGMYFR